MAKELNLNIADLLYTKGRAGLQKFESSVIKTLQDSLENLAIEAHRDVQIIAVRKIRDKIVLDTYLKGLFYRKKGSQYYNMEYIIGVGGEAYQWEVGIPKHMLESQKKPTSKFLNPAADQPKTGSFGGPNRTSNLATEVQAMGTRRKADSHIKPAQKKTPSEETVPKNFRGYQILPEVHRSVRNKLDNLVAKTFNKIIK